MSAGIPTGPSAEKVFSIMEEAFFVKEFKTIDEQIALLKSRGLIIPDENKAYLYLLTNNYYNIINGYSKYFPQDNQENYIAGTTFDEVWYLYIFDKELKKAFFEAILDAEAHLKAIFAYRFAELFPVPEYAYLHTDCYSQSQILSVGDVISKLSKLITARKKKNDTAIFHYFKKYENVPIWVLVNYMDFGTLRNMFSIVQDDVQNAVALDMCNFINDNKSLDLSNQNFDPKTMISFLENINDVRNICAHNNRLIGYQCRRDCRYWAPLHNLYGITPNDRRTNVYCVFLSLQCFLTITEYGTLHNTIRKRMNHLKNRLKSITINEILHTIGFPDDWYSTSSKIRY